MYVITHPRVDTTYQFFSAGWIALWKLKPRMEARICKLYPAKCFRTYWNYFGESNPSEDFGIPICALVNLLQFLRGCFCFRISKETTNPHLLYPPGFRSLKINHDGDFLPVTS